MARDKIAKDMMVRLDIGYTTALQLKRENWEAIRLYKSENLHLSIRACAVQVLTEVWNANGLD